MRSQCVKGDLVQSMNDFQAVDEKTLYLLRTLSLHTGHWTVTSYSPKNMHHDQRPPSVRSGPVDPF